MQAQLAEEKAQIAEEKAQFAEDRRQMHAEIMEEKQNRKADMHQMLAVCFYRLIIAKREVFHSLLNLQSPKNNMQAYCASQGLPPPAPAPLATPSPHTPEGGASNDPRSSHASDNNPLGASPQF
jgi:hypothetical protein